MPLEKVILAEGDENLRRTVAEFIRNKRIDVAEAGTIQDVYNYLGKDEFDLIFIDGRFRRRCLLAARDSLAPKGVVILHDAQRPHYHDALSAYPHVRMFNTGNMPGTSQPSTIALCSLNDGGFIDELAARYGKG